MFEGDRLIRIAAALPLALALAIQSASPAMADAKVSVRNSKGTTAIDPTYLTQLQLSGSGFQSIKNGHGGIYVLFGAVKGTWQPSKGGRSGENYFTVPDNETKNNGGYARFVTFPGSDTADSANGGQISSGGSWSTSINVPGAKFKTLNRSGKETTIDCREMTCGVITIGAHGVTNAKNETFTKVSVTDLYTASSDADSDDDDSASSASTTTSGASPTAAPSAVATDAAPAANVRPGLIVDRAAARPGRIVAFSAVGLTPGVPVNAIFDNGRAAIGPLAANSAGEVAGLLKLPKDLTAGTYELRLVGKGDMPRTRFAVIARSPEPGPAWLPLTFAITGLTALVGAVGFGAHRWRQSRAH